jgi:MtN3 and saliva related transmembrane protein
MSDVAKDIAIFNLDWKQIFGLIAGGLIAVSFIPQIWKLFKLKSAKEISLPFTLLQLCGGLMWLVYGFVLSLPAVIFTNIINVILVCLMVYAKIKYGK